MAFCSVSHVKLQINLHIPKKSSTFARKTCNMTETKRFKDIVVTEDLRDLLSEQGAAHGRAYMWQCRRGQIQFKYADNTYTMRRDDLLFSPANRLPDILNQSRDFRCTVFALDGKKTEDILYACLRKETDWIDQLHFVLRHPMIHLSPRQVKLIDSYRQLVHLYADETGRYRRRVAFLQGQSIIYELLSWVDEVMRPSGDSRTIVSSRMNQLYVAFLKLLDENGGTQRQVSWYAVQLQISSAYLNQVCRICIGKSPQAMIQDILCKESKRLLLSTDLNVKQIAYHLRFATEAAFCKFFRKQAGVSPAQFRANK
jgi:AraC-like DNA-binding protein